MRSPPANLGILVRALVAADTRWHLEALAACWEAAAGNVHLQACWLMIMNTHLPGLLQIVWDFEDTQVLGTVCPQDPFDLQR